jgi:CHAD domain-containing protein
MTITMNMQQLLFNALSQRREKYFAERQRCRDEFSGEAVHDLRVASRRLLALVDLVRALTPGPELQKLRRTLKGQLDSLDELRDTQVILTEISESIQELPELAPFKKAIGKREKQLLKSARRDVGDFKAGSIQRQIVSVMIEIARSDFDRDLTARTFGIVDEVYATISQRMSQIDLAIPSSIHRVRVVFKKFRYMIEIVHPVLPEFPEANLKSMHDYQSMMGDIQDADIFLHTLHEFAAQEPMYDPQIVQNVFERRRANLINAYLDNMNEAATFWRAAPEQPFPWESTKKGKKNESISDAPRHRRRTRRDDGGQPKTVNRKRTKKVEEDHAQPGEA